MKNCYSVLLATFFLLFTNNIKAATYYWVGGSGTWSTVGHWATSSGGTSFYTIVPSSTDDVVFDNNSDLASGTVTINSASYCRNMKWSGSGSPSLLFSNGILEIAGSVELQPGMTICNRYGNNPNNVNIKFTSTSPGNTIKNNGVIYGNGPR